MNNLIQGGADIILGGMQPVGMLSIIVVFIATLLLAGLVIYMIMNPPNSISGQIIYVIGIIIAVMLGFFTIMRGGMMSIRGFA